MPSLKAYLFNLNIYKTPDSTNENEYDHRSNKIALDEFFSL